MNLKLTLLILAILTSVLAVPVRADGIIIPEPPHCVDIPCPTLPIPEPQPMAQLAIRYHHVDVRIDDQVAITRVDQVFYNPNDWPVEGIYIFPLPVEAAVSSFSLWVDGEPVEGQILDAQQARQTYEEIVRSLRDPALLEYAGRGAVRASLFPIPAQGERRVELEYSQILTAEEGLVRYVYPLNTEKFSALPLESVSINIEISASSAPLRAVYSPSHPIAVSRLSDFRVKAGYEETEVLPTSDFTFFYSLGESEAFHLLTYRDPSDPSDPDGFFLLLLASRPDAAEQSLSKDVLLVLDRSGSMDGDKFQQAQQALRYVLTHLNPEDRFNLIAFSTGLETYASGLRPASEAQAAIDWVGGLSAEGSTDINRALLEAASFVPADESGGRPAYLIFLTDGLPTEGEIDSQKILDNLAAAAPKQLRLFVFGVGYDVDTFLLDSLAQAHHGRSTYVLPGERLDETLSAFYAGISTPVLTDLALDFGRILVYDLYPSPLPDLFAGSQIVVAGRYRQSGMADVTLTGNANGQARKFRFPDSAFADVSDQAGVQSPIPALWATRKIGHLLNSVRLNGPDEETVDQIVRLSIRYGIVTPYTSYLVTEPGALGAEEQARIAAEQLSQFEALESQPASGQAAVEKAAGQGALAGAQAPSSPALQASGTVHVLGSRAFVLDEGVWTDTAFDPQTMQTQKVAFLSEDYFALAQARPDLAAAFALGSRVIALAGGTAYEVVEEDAPASPIDLPPARTSVETAPGTASPVEAAPAGAASPSDRGLCLDGLMPLALLSLAGLVLWRNRCGL